MRALLTVLVLTWCAAAGAAQVRGRFDTLLSGREVARGDELVPVMPLYELVLLEVDGVALPGVDSASLVMQGFARLAIQDDPLAPNEGDLGLLYANLQRGPVLVRLGRQHLSSGVGRMRLIDGALVQAKLPGDFVAEATLGAMVHPEFTYHLGSWQTGGRLSKRLPGGLIGVGYIQERAEGYVSRDEVGLDGWYRLGPVQLVALAVANVGEERLSEARLAATLSATRTLRVTLDGERVAPDLLLPRTSIFSVFADTAHDAAGGEVAWAPSPYYELEGAAHALWEDQDWLGYRGAIKATTYREPAHRSLIGVEASRLHEDVNGYLRGRLFAGLGFHEAWRLALDLFGYRFDADVNGIAYSTLAQGSVIYDITPDMRVAVTVAGGVTPFAESQVEAMARFAYGYALDLGSGRQP